MSGRRGASLLAACAAPARQAAHRGRYGDGGHICHRPHMGGSTRRRVGTRLASHRGLAADVLDRPHRPDPSLLEGSLFSEQAVRFPAEVERLSLRASLHPRSRRDVDHDEFPSGQMTPNRLAQPDVRALRRSGVAVLGEAAGELIGLADVYGWRRPE